MTDAAAGTEARSGCPLRFRLARRWTPTSPDTGKDRPCLIVDLEQIEEAGLSGRVVVRVTYLPISHVATRGNEQAISIPPRVAQHLGLSSQQSYIYRSYAVEDDWPFDLAHVPGTDERFDHGFVPPRLFEAVVKDFKDYLTTHPQLRHRR
ncbi:MAG: hypothetical protein ABSC06_37830 [Rhodopila sp.]|jgi:hypothetical protein